jgi:hypothetical protein
MPQATRAAAARSEVKKTGRKIKIRNQSFTLPPTVKARLWQQMMEAYEGGQGQATVQVLEEILGPKQMERFWEIEVGLNGKGIAEGLADLINEAVEAILGATGTSAGE